MMISFTILAAWNKEFDGQLRPLVMPENRGRAIQVTADVVRMIMEGAEYYQSSQQIRIGRFTQWLMEEKKIVLSAKTVREILIANGLYSPQTRRRRPDFYQSLRQRIPNGLVSLDGSEVIVWLDQEAFKFNLEMAVDVGTFTHTGFSIGDSENAEEIIKVLEMHRQAWGTPLGMLCDSGSGNLSQSVQCYFDAHGIMRVSCGPGNPKGNGTDEGAFSQFKEVMGECRIDTTSPRNLARSILETITAVYIKMRNKLTARGEVKAPAAKMNEPVNGEDIEAEKRRLQGHIQAKTGREADPRVGLLQAMLHSLCLIAEPEALKRAEKTITGFETGAITAAEEAFVKAVNRKPERKTLPYFFGILKRIQKERDDEAYQAHCRTRYNYEQIQKRENAQRELQAQNKPPKIEQVIEMLVRAEVAPSRTIREFATRRAKAWTEELMKGCRYFGVLKKKAADALMVLSQLNAEQKEKVYRIFEGFIIQNPVVESVT